VSILGGTDIAINNVSAIDLLRLRQPAYAHVRSLSPSLDPVRTGWVSTGPTRIEAGMILLRGVARADPRDRSRRGTLWPLR